MDYLEGLIKKVPGLAVREINGEMWTPGVWGAVAWVDIINP